MNGVFEPTEVCVKLRQKTNVTGERDHCTSTQKITACFRIFRLCNGQDSSWRLLPRFELFSHVNRDQSIFRASAVVNMRCDDSVDRFESLWRLLQVLWDINLRTSNCSSVPLSSTVPLQDSCYMGRSSPSGSFCEGCVGIASVCAVFPVESWDSRLGTIGDYSLYVFTESKRASFCGRSGTAADLAVSVAGHLPGLLSSFWVRKLPDRKC